MTSTSALRSTLSGTPAQTSRRWPRLVPGALPWVALLLVWVVFVRPLPRYDYRVFVHAGAQVLTGHSPYLPLTSHALYGGSAYVYPWLVAFPFVPFTLLPGGVADLLYLALSGAALVIGCRLAGLRDPLLIVLVLTSQTAIRGFEVGSLNTFLFLACVLAWQHRDRAVPVAVTLTIAVGSKVFLLPLLGWLAVTRRWRALLLTGTGVALVIGISTLAGPVSLPQYLKMLAILAQHEGLQGLSLYRLLAHHLTGSQAQTACVAVALGLTAVGLLAARREHDSSDLLTFTCFLLVALVLTPVLWSHYLLLTFVPLVLTRPAKKIVLFAWALSWTAAGLGLPWQASILVLLATWITLLIWLRQQQPRAESPSNPNLLTAEQLAEADRMRLSKRRPGSCTGLRGPAREAPSSIRMLHPGRYIAG